jgi:hypothetical protein
MEQAVCHTGNPIMLHVGRPLGRHSPANYTDLVLRPKGKWCLLGQLPVRQKPIDTTIGRGAGSSAMCSTLCCLGYLLEIGFTRCAHCTG